MEFVHPSSMMIPVAWREKMEGGRGMRMEHLGFRLSPYKAFRGYDAFMEGWRCWGAWVVVDHGTLFEYETSRTGAVSI